MTGLMSLPVELLTKIFRLAFSNVTVTQSNFESLGCCDWPLFNRDLSPMVMRALLRSVHVEVMGGDSAWKNWLIGSRRSGSRFIDWVGQTTIELDFGPQTIYASRMAVALEELNLSTSMPVIAAFGGPDIEVPRTALVELTAQLQRLRMVKIEFSGGPLSLLEGVSCECATFKDTYLLANLSVARRATLEHVEIEYCDLEGFQLTDLASCKHLAWFPIHDQVDLSFPSSLEALDLDLQELPSSHDIRLFRSMANLPNLRRLSFASATFYGEYSRDQWEEAMSLIPKSLRFLNVALLPDTEGSEDRDIPMIAIYRAVHRLPSLTALTIYHVEECMTRIRQQASETLKNLCLSRHIAYHCHLDDLSDGAKSE
jgi:hypothetical protein